MGFVTRLKKSAVKVKAAGSREKKDEAERDAARGMVVAPVVGLDPLALREPANAGNAIEYSQAMLQTYNSAH